MSNQIQTKEEDQSKFSFREGQSFVTKELPNTKQPNFVSTSVFTERRHVRMAHDRKKSPDPILNQLTKSEK